MTTKSVILQTNNLTKIYNPNKHPSVIALDKINLTIYKGDFIGVVGRSGSGKTTLLNTLGTLDTPSNGEVIFEGKNLKNHTSNQLALIRRYKIGFIFQTFKLLPTLTVAENIKLAITHQHLPQTQTNQKISDMLAFLEIPNKTQSYPNELSIGQQQKVAIARALIKDPLIIFADEPTGEMDPIATKEIISKLQELNKKSKITIIVASHDNLLSKIADQTIYLKNGKITTKQQAGY